jgi:hypothetical protein
MIDPIRPVITIWIRRTALERWVNGESMPYLSDVKFTPTEMFGWRVINISYKTYQDLEAHLEQLVSDNASDLPF